MIIIAQVNETDDVISRLLSDRGGCYYQIKQFDRELLTNLFYLMQSFLFSWSYRC